MQSIVSIWLFDGIWGIWFTAQRFFALLWGGDVQDSEKTSMHSKLHLTNHHSSQQNVLFCSSQLSKVLNNYHPLVATLKKKPTSHICSTLTHLIYLGTNDVPFKTKRFGFGSSNLGYSLSNLRFGKHGVMQLGDGNKLGKISQIFVENTQQRSLYWKLCSSGVPLEKIYVIIEYNLIYKWLYILYAMLQSIYIYILTNKARIASSNPVTSPQPWSNPRKARLYQSFVSKGSMFVFLPMAKVRTFLLACVLVLSGQFPGGMEHDHILPIEASQESLNSNIKKLIKVKCYRWIPIHSIQSRQLEGLFNCKVVYLGTGH